MARLPQDNFEVLTSSTGFRITPTTQLSFNGIAQYDNQSKTIGLNTRFRYIIKPGSDLFLVFNKGFDRGDDGELRNFRTFKTFFIIISFLTGIDKPSSLQCGHLIC